MCALAACVARTSGPCGQKVVMNVTGGGVSEIVGSLVGLSIKVCLAVLYTLLRGGKISLLL